MTNKMAGIILTACGSSAVILGVIRIALAAFYYQGCGVDPAKTCGWPGIGLLCLGIVLLVLGIEAV